jgi:hypothetical protein
MKKGYTIQELVDIDMEGEVYKNRIENFWKSIEPKEIESLMYPILAPIINCYPNKKYKYGPAPKKPRKSLKEIVKTRSRLLPQKEDYYLQRERTREEAITSAYYSIHELSA